MGIFSFSKEPVLRMREYAYGMIGCGDLEKAILVLGSPRSGTTWLAQMISTLPGYKHLDEPFRLAPPLVSRLNLRERNFADTHEDKVLLNHYVELALQGKIDGNYQVPGTLKLRRAFEMWMRPQVVAKFIRANRMAHYLDSNFNVRGMVIIVRHPCAVVASHIKKWGPNPFPHSSQKRVGEDLPPGIYKRFRDVLESVHTPEEKIAAVWALDTFCAIENDGAPPGSHVVKYEELVRYPEETISNLFRYLGDTVPEPVWEAVNIPSRSAASDLRLSDADKQLSKWKEELSSDMVSRIFETVSNLGVNLYQNKQ
jgi:hypothetical protein